jgi:hypothetical protein
MKKISLFIFIFIITLNAENNNLVILNLTSKISTSSRDISAEGKKLTKNESFVKENFEEIQIDIVKGGGEYLDALASLYKIKNIEVWTAYLQKNYISLFTEI